MGRWSIGPYHCTGGASCEIATFIDMNTAWTVRSGGMTEMF